MENIEHLYLLNVLNMRRKRHTDNYQENLQESNETLKLFPTFILPRISAFAGDANAQGIMVSTCIVWAVHHNGDLEDVLIQVAINMVYMASSNV